MTKKKAKLEISSSRHKKITEKIAGVLIHDFQSFSFAEDKGFKELMQELEPCYEIPHRTIFSRSVIPRIYKEVKEQVKSKVRSRFAADKEQDDINNRYVDIRNEAYLG